jgi:hypothetical protein
MRLVNWHRSSLLARRAVVAAALAAYLVSLIGVPVVKRTARHAGAPFPCQDHACGCSSAEQCWKSCCCYSPAQKLAWAQEHGVEPPAALVAEVALDASLASVGTSPTHAGCCDEHDHQAAHHGESCDHEHTTCGAGHCDEHAAADDATEFALAMGPQARHCRGLVDLWCASGAVLPPPPAVAWQFQWVVVDWLAPAPALLASRDLLPPVPPPRV